jgi:uncharacterized Fe-S cluster-containing radical SAM superfamily protein
MPDRNSARRWPSGGCSTAQHASSDLCCIRCWWFHSSYAQLL